MPIPPHPIHMVSLHLSSTINTTRTRPSFTPTPTINSPRPSIFPATPFHLLINNSRWLLLHRQLSSSAKKEIRAETFNFSFVVIVSKVNIYISGLTRVCPGRPAGLIGFYRVFALTVLLPNRTSLATGSLVDPPGRSGFNNYDNELCFYI
jgi:hypothetical protein